MANKVNVIAVLIWIGISSCQKENTVAPSKFYEHYFPVSENSWIEYQVDSFHHDITSDSFTYFLREEISNLNDEQFGSNTFELRRSIKTKESGSWNVKEIWLIEKKENSREIVEENRRYVKLVFPVKLNQAWDGNAYNELEKENYTITEVHVPHSINGHIFDSTITIEQHLRINLIDSVIAIEKYATNIGLIEKTDINLDFGSGNRKGYEIRKKILNFKN